MRNITFHFEIKDLITQFVTAFDNIIIKRYDSNRVPQNLLQVRYVYSPKQRVMYDLVNKAQNLTVPVVAVNITSVSRDETRVFNKLNGFYFSKGTSDTSAKSKSTFVASPIPVNIGINMSILTKFQSDMDQIISNFVPYNNPYIIISWKVPQDLTAEGLSPLQEIRSEVLWDGNIALSYPTDINASDKYRIAGDTTFIIKGWLFQASKDSVGNIFYVDANFYNSRIISNYETLSSIDYEASPSGEIISTTETVSVSGFPQITNIDYQL